MNEKPLVAISIDFFDAFARLPKQQQGKVTTFMNKFRMDPTAPGINFEKINGGVDKSICSVRIDDTYRGIVVKRPEDGVYMLLWVDHHDEAYDWAKRKKCVVNKTTGSVQVFEVQSETVTESVESLFKNVSDETLIKIGLPEEQLQLIRQVSDLDGLYEMKSIVPAEAYEGLEWLGNGFPESEVLELLAADENPENVDETDFVTALQNDNSRKSFYVVSDDEELEKIMDEPLEKWRIFLHPTQRKIVNKKYNGPARVLGTAGTGKTVVAMHRAKKLASEISDGQKILFTTFTRNLADDIRDNLQKICTKTEMQKIEIINLDAWVSNYLHVQGYEYKIVYEDDLEKVWDEAITIAGAGLDFPREFYIDEWTKVLEAQEAFTKEKYIKAPRIGRGTRLDRKKKLEVWDVFEEYQNIMNEKLWRDTEQAMYECRTMIEDKIKDGDDAGRYAAVIVDEGQDLSQSAYRLLRSLVGEEHENDMFIVGDAHQRIYRNKAILSKCGINIRGRSSKLKINYRTTEEIRKYAFALLNGISFDDLDESSDDGTDCESLTHGNVPEIKQFSSPEEELKYIIDRIKDIESNGGDIRNICIVARTHKLIDNYIIGLQEAGIRSYEIKNNKTDDRSMPGVRIATMHRVKGLEFDYVMLAAVNKKWLPLKVTENFADDVSAQEFNTGERCLLYVALTRARRSACITCYGEMSGLVK